MHNTHARNTVRYYILIVVLISFLFFSNDFGLLDVQKTALILAVGIDKEEDDFIITSQIALPQDSKQGKATQAVQLVSRGKTVADAFEEINAKTGWYPKLVFCNLIVIGEDAAKEDVFNALDYFLLDEYFSDNCLLATCDGSAKALLNVSALVDPSSSAAIAMILSNHAERVGTVLPSTLHDFAIGYYGDSQSGLLPVIATQPQQEPTQKNENDAPADQSQNGDGGQSGESGGGGDSGSGGEQNQAQSKEEKPVFTARETALFLRGKRVATLTADETFAFSAVKKSLKLAPFTVTRGEGDACTLNVRQNDPKLSLRVSDEGAAVLKIKITLSAGIFDYSKALPLEDISDVGDVPDGIFAAAEKKLAAEIVSVFEKARVNDCDIFGVQALLVKHKPRTLQRYKTTILKNTRPDVQISFRNVR